MKRSELFAAWTIRRITVWAVEALPMSATPMRLYELEAVDVGSTVAWCVEYQLSW
jgi:hypothetical protein